MTIFYLIRHGQNDRRPGDQPLNETGRRQAQETAAFFRNVPVDAVYTSPLARAKETAQAIADALDLILVEDDCLRERANLGDRPGQTLEEFMAMWRRCDRDRDYVPEVGLSARQNGKRLEGWMRGIYRRYPHGTVAVGTHGGTISDFLLNRFPQRDLAQRLPGFPHTIANCSITEIRFDGEHFTLAQLAVADHLA